MDGPGSRWMIRNPAIFFSPSSTSIPLPPFPFSPTPATSPPPPPSPPKMASPSETTPLPELSATTTTAIVDAKDEEKEIETARPAIAFPDEQEKSYHSTGAGFPRVGTTNTLRRQLTRDEKELANAGYEVPATEPTGHEVKQVDIVRFFFFPFVRPSSPPRISSRRARKAGNALARHAVQVLTRSRVVNLADRATPHSRCAGRQDGRFDQRRQAGRVARTHDGGGAETPGGERSERAHAAGQEGSLEEVCVLLDFFPFATFMETDTRARWWVPNPSRL